MSNWYPSAAASVYGLDPAAPPKGKFSKSLSLPTIGGSSSSRAVVKSPLENAQPLVHMEVAKRRVVRKAVGGIERKGKGVRIVDDTKFGFYASERGLEWERPFAKAQLPKDPLSNIEEVLYHVQKEFDIDQLRSAAQERLQGKRSIAFGGAPRYMGGPRLPIRRPRSSLQFLPDRSTSTRVSFMSEVQSEATSVEELLPGLGMDLTPEAAASAPTEQRRRSSIKIGVEEEPVVVEEDNSDTLPFPWSEDELLAAFVNFDTDRDGELQKDELRATVEYLGVKTNKEDILRLAEEQTTFATLSFEEFNEFMHRYRELDVEKLRILFNTYDADDSGTLSFDELNDLIMKTGYASTRQVVVEAMSIIDANGDGNLNFREFEQLREHLRKCEGFLQQDLEEIKDLYTRAIQNKPVPADELSTDECWRITMYLGFSATESDVIKFAALVDADGTGLVSLPEMLKIVRRVKETEQDLMRRVLAAHGENPDQLPIENLGLALSDLGYFVSEEAVFEILDSLGEANDPDFLTFEELSAFMIAYRRTEGFLESEMEELKMVFEREHGGSHALGTLEIGRVLRWFGFSRTVQEVQRLVDEVDFDGSGKLEFGEYVKLMRRFYQAEAQKRFEIFNKMDVNNLNEVHRDYLPRMITMLQGVQPDPEILQAALKPPPKEEGGDKEVDKKGEEQEKKKKTSPFIDRRGWEAFCKRYRDLVVTQVRANGGYTPIEVQHFRGVFQRFDQDASGTIEAKELRQLIAEYFPEATKSKAGQKMLQDMLGEIDDGNMEIEFKEFLWLMRRCDDMRDERDIKMEAEIVKECGFSTEEVEGYRQIFSSMVDWKGDMNIEPLLTLLMNVVEKITVEQEEQLVQMVRDVHPEKRQVCRFPQFLKLLKKITEDNALGVNDAATRVVRRDEKMRGKR